MKNIFILILSIPILLGCSKSFAKPINTEPKTEEPATANGERKEIVYRQIGDVSLKMVVTYPDNFKKGDRLPAIVLFYGGGWNTAAPTQFAGQAKYLNKEGMITILADYRVKNSHNTTPFDALDDARVAISYVREHTNELGVDPNKLAAGGGSAGGHLAAACDLTGTGTIQGSNTSCRPNALVLFNPVFNNGPGNYGYERFGDRYIEISPYHNIKKGAAPTIVFLGTKDDLIPVSVAQDYKKAMENVGNQCDLHLYEDQTHGFFNRTPYFDDTIEKTAAFLRSLGYLPKK